MRVFISHSTTNRPSYENLRHSLKYAGIDIWNVDSMAAGAGVSEQLRSAIAACGTCVFIATKTSTKSPWCLAELGAFWGAGKPVIVYVEDATLTEAQLAPELRGQFRVSTHEKVIQAIQTQHSHRRPSSEIGPRRIPGLRLFQHPGYYPVDLEPTTNRPLANRETFARAIDHLLGANASDRLAAMDLVYLRVDNLPHIPDLLLDSHRARFAELVARYDLRQFLEDFVIDKERVFKDYCRIVNDIGDSLRGIHFEILLHDVRNPFRSIVAARNSEYVSGRLVGDPSTRFVVNYVKNQGEDILALEEGSKVAYLKQFTRSKKVKATTTPVFDDLYGLVGVLCCNVDVEAIESLSRQDRERVLENLCANSGLTPEFEK